MGSQEINCHIDFLKVNILIVPNFLTKKQLIRVIFTEREKQRQIVCSYFLVEIIRETIIDNSKGAAKVVSEEEGDMVSIVDLYNLDVLLFKGKFYCKFSFPFYLQ